MMLEPHTPYSHSEHKYPCGCSVSRETDYFICKNCGAAYTNMVLSFVQWRCYDCGNIVRIIK